MNKSLQQVKEFHETFSHLVGNIEEVEPLSVRQLRIKLLFEELMELAEASDCRETLKQCCLWTAPMIDASDGDNVNQLEELDALCDLQYVLNGKIITAGMHEIFDRNFDLVHENNMAKAHTSREHGIETMQKLSNGVSDGEPAYELHSRDNGMFVLTNTAGKIIKPWDHKKVELSLK